METSSMIILMIGACILFMGFAAFSKPIKIILQFLIQGAVGVAGIYFFNMILSGFSLSVGLNLINAAFIGALGVPGLFSLYILQAIL